jgi:hypothetical protein
MVGVVSKGQAGRTTAVAGALSVIAGVGVAMAPSATLYVVAALLVLAMALGAPRLTAGVAVLAVLFVRPLEHVTQVDSMSYLDEAAIVLCALTMPVRRLALGRPLRTFPGQWWFVAFILLGLLSGLALRVPSGIFLSGAFVLCKGLLLAWAVAQVDWTERHLLVAARVGTVVLVLSMVACLGNLAMPGRWFGVMASDPNAVEARSFLPSIIGPFSHPIDLGQFMALSAVAVAAWRATVRRSAFTLGLLLASTAGAVLTARRTASASLAAAWLAVQAIARRTRVLLGLAVVLPAAVVLLSGPAVDIVRLTYHDYIGKGTPEARTVLTLDSFAVAADHFPFGAGFGRFGSAVAQSNYSPEYVARGYPDIWGLGRSAEEGRFLTDTEWPAIIGETGFFGAFAFALGLVGILRAGRRLLRTARSALFRWVGVTAVGWLVALFVQSIGTVSFTGPPVAGVFFGLTGILAALLDPAPAAARGPEGIAAGHAADDPELTRT